MAIGKVPRDLPLNHQQFLSQLKKAVEDLQPSNLPPGRPSNLTVNPLPGGNQILFTGGDGADGHLLQMSTTANWNPGKAGSAVIDLGLSTQHTDMVGMPGVTKWYWVIATKGTNRSDPPTGPAFGTTLALGTPAAAAKFVPSTPSIAKSAATRQPTILTPRRGGQQDEF